MSYPDNSDFNEYGSERFTTDVDRVYYDDYVDAINRGISSDNPKNISIVDVVLKVLKMLTVDPVGSHQIFEGVEGAVGDFIKDLIDGDMASVSRRLDDVDNLTSNLLLYLVGRGVSKEAINRLRIGKHKLIQGKLDV